MTEVLVDLDPDIKRAARLVAYQWPGVVTEDDMVQDIYLHLLERPNQVDKLRRTEDDKARYRNIARIGHQIASQERKDYSYFSGNYHYSHNEVTNLLRGGALTWSETDADVQRPVDEDVVGKPKKGGVRYPVSAAVVDVRKGMDLLVKRHPPYAEAITRRYLFEEYPSTTKDKNALKNGLVALVEEMNRAHRTAFVTRDDGIGTRDPVSRVAAGYVSQANWDGDAQMSLGIGLDP